MNPAAAVLAVPDGALVPVCAVDDVPLGEGRAATVAGRRIAIFNTTTGWYALENACPHRGGPLADGIVADRCVTCPLHERRFDLETGAAVGGDEVARTFPVVVSDGLVLVACRAQPSWRASQSPTTCM